MEGIIFNPVFLIIGFNLFFIVVGCICGKVCSYIAHKPEEVARRTVQRSTSISTGSRRTSQERRHSTAKSSGSRRTSRRTDSFNIGFDEWV